MNETQKIFIDVAGIRNYVRNTDTVSGIQRVLFELIKQGRSKEFRDIYLSYFDTAERRYYAVPLILDKLLTDLDINGLRSILWPEHCFDQKYRLHKYRGKPGKYLYAKFRASILGRNGRRPSEFWEDLHKRALYQPHSVQELARRGDVLLLMDAHIGMTELAEILRRMSDHGVRICQFVHDLIPYLSPHLYYGDHVLNFINWLDQTVTYVSDYICNSRQTEVNMAAYLQSRNSDIRTTMVPLARERVLANQKLILGDLEPDLHLGVRGEVRSALAHRFVLCVGTREIRKNNWRLLSAWDALQKEGVKDLPKLVFAGRRGWLNDDFEEFLQASGHLKGMVKLIDSPSDVELDFLYRHCLFTAYVSMCEGWGLPIGEAVAYGKTGIYSQVAPMPEVGLGSGEYCDPFSVASIADAARKLILKEGRRRELEAEAAAIGVRSWESVASDIFGSISQHRSSLIEIKQNG